MKKKIAVDPVMSFLQQFTVREPACQCTLTTPQLWSKEHFVRLVKAWFDLEFKVSGKLKKHCVASQEKFVMKRFAELLKEEKKVWQRKAWEVMKEVKCGKKEMMPGLILLPLEEAQK